MIFTKSFKPKPLYLLEFYRKYHNAGNFCKHQDPDEMPQVGGISYDILFRRYGARNEASDVPVHTLSHYGHDG